MIPLSRYLFGVDLEDPRMQVSGGQSADDRVVLMTEKLLDFLEKHGAKATFFVVGDVARAHSHLVRLILGHGHEIACHSDRHQPLELQGPQNFREDLLRNLEALADAGASNVRGYRAPCFSLTKKTAWAYPILEELGFTYSSSVLPAPNPLYGWPGFGTRPRLSGGLVELPMTLLPFRALPVPAGGGVYFRVLPQWLLRQAFTRHQGSTVTGYIHPYDIDEQQERFAIPGMRRNGLFERLMFFNRGAVFPRLTMVASLGFRFVPYGQYAEEAREALLEKQIKSEPRGALDSQPQLREGPSR